MDFASMVTGAVTNITIPFVRMKTVPLNNVRLDIQSLAGFIRYMDGANLASFVSLSMLDSLVKKKESLILRNYGKKSVKFSIVSLLTSCRTLIWALLRLMIFTRKWNRIFSSPMQIAIVDLRPFMLLHHQEQQFQNL